MVQGLLYVHHGIQGKAGSTQLVESRGRHVAYVCQGVKASFMGDQIIAGRAHMKRLGSIYGELTVIRRCGRFERGITYLWTVTARL